MSKKLDNFLTQKLGHDEKVALSFYEWIVLNIIARNDALHGLPRENEYGIWTSPTIQLEINRHNEEHKKVYGFFHMEMEKEISELSILVDKMKNLNAKVKELRKEIPQSPSEEEKHIRKTGEKDIDEHIIVSRRLREYRKEVAKIQEKINPIQEERDMIFEKIIDLKNYLDEKYNQAHIVCERIRIRAQLRIDVYWRAINKILYRKGIIIPVSYTEIPISDVIGQFKTLQDSTNQNIVEAIELYQNLKEVA